MFLRLMEPLYHATLAISPDQKPTVGLVMPLVDKLEVFYSPNDGSTFEKKGKKSIFDNLAKRYLDHDLVNFLEEATALDPRVKQSA